MSTGKRTSGNESIELTAERLKGLAHPLRVRILGALRTGGPATATGLAARLGESSGSTSYHLRQLEKHGFVLEVEGSGSKRERWWKAAQRNTRFDEAGLIKDSEAGELAAEFLRTIAAAMSERMLKWIEALPRMPEDFAKAGTMSDWSLRLDARQLKALKTDIEKTISGYPSFDPEEEGAPDSVLVGVQLQLLPKIP